MTTLSKRIKELRQQENLTQEEFGRIFGIVKSTVSLYESSKSTPDNDLKKKIAKHYNISLDYLMGVSHIKNLEQVQAKKPTIEKIEELSEESRKELDKYIELLRIKDQVEKSKDETSSALEKKFSE